MPSGRFCATARPGFIIPEAVSGRPHLKRRRISNPFGWPYSMRINTGSAEWNWWFAQTEGSAPACRSINSQPTPTVGIDTRPPISRRRRILPTCGARTFLSAARKNRWRPRRHSSHGQLGQRDKALGNRVFCQAGDAADIELAHQVFAMSFDGSGAEIQAAGNFLVTQAFSEVREHFLF